MTDTLAEHADPELTPGEPLIQMSDVGKTYGAIRALQGVNLTVAPARSPASSATTAPASRPSSRSWPACTRTTRAP